MELLRDFKKLGKNDVNLAGGKGASLGEMTQAGIPVPTGFVVLSTSFERFLDETDLNVEIDAILDSVDHKVIHTIDNASEKIKAIILQAKMPEDIAAEIQKSFKSLNIKYVAVRSSATAEDGTDHAWAGQLESFLNATEIDLLDKVKHCWASLFTSRAIFYRFERELHATKISVAVVVQKMVESEKSGIAFSVHPITQDKNQLIIEAGFGLGEAIVSGSITPDSYVVEKEPRRIIDTNVSNQTRGLYRAENGGNEWRELGGSGEKKVLDEKQILQLSEIILKIENHYGFPCDIEWAFEDEKFYIVQSRPITTLGTIPKERVVEYEKMEYMENIFPLDLYSLELGWSSAVKRKEFDIPSLEFVLDFHGNKATLYCDGQKYKSAVINIINVLENSPEFGDNLRQRHLSYLSELENLSLTIKDGDNLIELHLKLQDLIYKNSYEFIEENAVNLHSTILAEKLTKILGSNQAVTEILYPLDISHFQKYEVDILKLCTKLNKTEITSKYLLSNFKNQVMLLLENYAWISAGFNDQPKTIEKITDEIKDILSTGKSSEQLLKEKIHQIESSQSTRKNLESRLSKILSEKDYGFVKLAQQLTNQVQKRIEAVLELIYLSRTLYNKISNKVGLVVEDMKYLTPDEISKLITADNIKEYKNLIYERKSRMIIKFLDGKVKLLNDFRFEDTTTNSNLKGQVAYPGIVEGIVKIVNNPSENGKVESGNILVSSRTSPELVPAMNKAGAIISELGGLLCHAAIVSREMKKPCIVGVKNATQLLKDGDYILVNADSGFVKIIKK